MGTSVSSNHPPMAVTNSWWDSGQSGGDTLWKTRTAYVGYEEGPRKVSFTFPDLPTSNITINNITVSLDVELKGDFKNRNGFVLTVAGTDYTAPPSQITIYSGWTETLSSQTLTIPMRGKYTPSSTSCEGGDKPSSEVYVTFSATATWSYNYQTLSKPGNVSLSSTYITSSSSSTLSWSAVSNSPYANSVSGYQVYRDGQAYGQPTTSTSMSVSGAAAGTYYDFTVKAISNVSGYDSEPSSAARLYIYGNNYSATLKLYTNVNKTSANTIYMGASNRPDIIPDLDVKSADYDGYNPTSGVDKDYDATTGIYTATITFYSGRTTTATAYVKSIEAPSPITFKGNLDEGTITAQDITYSWDAIEVENATVKYVISDSASPQTGTSYTKTITDITRGTPFALSVKARAYGSYGGYTDSEERASTSVYRAQNLFDGTWTPPKLKGVGIDNAETAATYTFGEVEIYWAYTPATYGGALSSISYNRKVVKDDGSTDEDSQSASLSAGDTSYIDNVKNISKSTLTYTITFTDIYGQTRQFDAVSIIKLDAPTVELTGITFSPKTPPIQGATLHFIITPVGASRVADMRYKIEIGYEDDPFYEVQPETEWNTDTSCGIQYNLKTIAEAGGLPKLYAALTRTSSAPVGMPRLRYRLTAYDIQAKEAKGTATISEITDFTTKPTLTGTLAAKNTSNSTLSYANSTDAITISGITATHKNFFGDETTDHLTNTLIRNGNMTLVNEAVGGQHFPFTSTLGTISTDSTYNYVYTVRKQYSDAYTDDFATCSLPVKKWVEPLVSLTNLDWSSSGTSYSITGRLYSGTTLWGGSPSVDNIKQIDIFINTVDDTGTETEARHYTFEPVGNLIDNQQYATFSISRPEMVDTQLNAKVIITSTSNKTYTLSAPLVLVKEQGIPFAIRKHGTGVNIPKGFNPSTNDAAIQITGNMDTDNVATFTNGPNRDNTDFIIQNDKGGTADTGKARLSLHKNGTEWTLSIIFD